MSVISDLLGIDHFTCSRGSTIRADFLLATARALQVDEEVLRDLSKDEVLAAIVEAATRAPMDPSLFSPGGTVTNTVLQVIIDGLLVNGVPGRPGLPPVELDPVEEGPSDWEPFDPALVQDERDYRLLEIATRQGQDRFRAAVLDAYDERCAVTDYDAVETLEAAHIYPYQGPATNLVTNGLLLRADVHALYDRGAVSVDEQSYEVLCKPHLLATQYRDLDGRRLRLPRRRNDRPSTAALRSHREWAGFQ